MSRHEGGCYLIFCLDQQLVRDGAGEMIAEQDGAEGAFFSFGEGCGGPVHHEVGEHLGQFGKSLPFVISACLCDQRETRSRCVPFGRTGGGAIRRCAIQIET
jgi:hypothetical protein